MILFVLSAAGAARAALELALNRNKKPPPRVPNRPITRSFTSAELSPLLEPGLGGFVREPSTFQHTAMEIAVESATELVEQVETTMREMRDRLSAIQALSACPVSFGDVGFALSAGGCHQMIQIRRSRSADRSGPIPCSCSRRPGCNWCMADLGGIDTDGRRLISNGHDRHAKTAAGQSSLRHAG